MSKKTKVLSGLALVAGTVAISANAQAEEVTAQVTTETSVTTAQEVTESKVTAQAVAEASQANQSAQEAVRQQEIQLDASKASLVSAETAVSDAQVALDSATELVQKATPEAIAQAETTVSERQSDIETATKTLADAKAQEESAQAQVQAQESTVASATSAVETQKTVVETAKDAVMTAENVLNGSGQAEAEKAVSDLTTEVASDKETVADLETKVASASASEKEKATAIETIKTSLNDAKAELVSKTTELQSANATLDSTKQTESLAQSAVDSANALVSKLESESPVKNTITVPAGYGEALDDYLDRVYAETLKGNFNRKSVDSTALQALAAKALADANNTYKSSEADKAVVITDIMNISQDLREDLTLFAVDLINQVRSQVGTELATANLSAIAMADQIANESKEGHDVPVITATAADFGLNSKNNYYENLGINYVIPSKTQFTLDELKKTVYNNLMRLLFKDQNASWGHAQSISSVSASENGFNPISTKFGIDLSRYQSDVRVHFIGVPEAYILDETKFDASANIQALSTSDALDQAKATLATKTAELEKATSAVAEATAQVETKETAVSNQQALVTSLEAKLASLTSDSSNLADLTAQLDQAKAKLASDESALAQAKTTLATITADKATKEANLADAKILLATEEAKLDELTNIKVNEEAKLEILTQALSAIKDKINVAEQAVLTAQTTLKEAQNNLDNLLHAEEHQSSAQARLEKAEQALSLAQANLSTEQAKLDQLKALAEQAQVAYDKVLAQYQTQEAQVQHDAIIKNGGQPVAIKDENGIIVAYVDGTADEKQAIQTAYNKTVTKQVSAKVLKEKPQASYQVESASLPNTGDDQTAIFSLMGVAMLGLVGVGAKRKFQ